MPLLVAGGVLWPAELPVAWEKFCYIIFRVNLEVFWVNALLDTPIPGQGSLPHAERCFTPQNVLSSACAELLSPRVQRRQVLQSQSNRLADKPGSSTCSEAGAQPPRGVSRAPRTPQQQLAVRLSFPSGKNGNRDGFQASPPANQTVLWDRMSCLWPGPRARARGPSLCLAPQS